MILLSSLKTTQDECEQEDMVDEIINLRSVLDDYKLVPAGILFNNPLFRGHFAPIFARPYSTMVPREPAAFVSPHWCPILVPLIQQKITELTAALPPFEEEDVDDITSSIDDMYKVLDLVEGRV
eukprot:TRINITY_DN9481_c0_g3_i1.p1 TRINITY_DN9481_c0_g3~~TRINITY_DN9481_c0_g3_i1.p1  ORF type:complete len:124 (-),score=16.26 TRINITY_DN9481_c0_g3_i1:17-388(-)